MSTFIQIELEISPLLHYILFSIDLANFAIFTCFERIEKNRIKFLLYIYLSLKQHILHVSEHTVIQRIKILIKIGILFFRKIG